MKNIDFSTFNKGLYIRMSHTEKWEKGKIEAIRVFLSENSPVPPEKKNDLPQFILNVEEGSKSTTLKYPQEFLVTELDLPSAIKKQIDSNLVLKENWQQRFMQWYSEFQKANIPYWLMYITPSRMGIRFVIQSEVLIKNAAMYKEACLQFLKLLESYGVNADYHDLVSVNRGWYFPPDKEFCHLKGESFKPELLDLTTLDKNTIKKANRTKSENKENLDRLIQQIEEKEIDITVEYLDWINSGFALASELGELGIDYFHRISRFYPGYNTQACDRQFNFCLKSGRGEITIRTLFFIAKKYGIVLSQKNSKASEIFWEMTDKGLKINYSAYFNMLHSNGIGRLNRENKNDIVFIQVNRINKTVKPIDKFGISDFTMQHIAALEIEPDLKEGIENAFLSDTKVLMPKNYAAVKPIDIEFMKDSASNMYLFFSNCYIEVNHKMIVQHEYSELQGYIWESQIIPFDISLIPYRTIKKKSEFSRFIQDVTSDLEHDDNYKRFQSIKTAIGYLLHTFKDPAIPKSVVFMDASLNKDTKGRTGKGIVKNALSKMRKLASEDGKRFNFRSQFSFSQVSIDTDILFIDDIASSFDFEMLYSVLAEGIVVEQKYKDKFHLSYEESPKVLLTTNYAIRGDGDSFEGRIFEFEFSDFYRLGYSPKERFGHLLFNDWDQTQWNLFYNFMLFCAKSYLKLGLRQAPFINLPTKRIVA
ncbi:MAG: PriCT-2 domain-containing protein, partial [Bacteroidota bacterium]